MQWDFGTTGQDREVAAQPGGSRCRGQPGPQCGRPLAVNALPERLFPSLLLHKPESTIAT